MREAQSVRAMPHRRRLLLASILCLISPPYELCASDTQPSPSSDGEGTGRRGLCYHRMGVSRRAARPRFFPNPGTSFS
ncbi:hypothetical protein GGS23DRAFT_589736, partial [Durotheca rogersii]|uniref:uncharacterized protein n=1 Tax=Durotheca rogersii TaxID=419775 RepID=UPI00221F0F07